MNEPFELPRSETRFNADGSIEIQRGDTSNVIHDLIELFSYSENRQTLKDDLIENAALARNPDWIQDGGKRIRKSDFITGIRHSLDYYNADGLDRITLSEDHCQEEAYSVKDSDYSELQNCFENNFLQDKVAEHLADSITDHAWDNADFNSAKAKDDFIKDLAENYDNNGTWKDFVEETMTECDKKHNLEVSPFFRKNRSDAYDFLHCVINKLRDERDNLYDGFFEHCRESFYKTWNINDKEHLQELSEETGVPLEIINHCVSFEYEPLEKYRPIKENQTFLESYGADIWEPSENNKQ